MTFATNISFGQGTSTVCHPAKAMNTTGHHAAVKASGLARVRVLRIIGMAKFSTGNLTSLALTATMAIFGLFVCQSAIAADATGGAAAETAAPKGEDAVHEHHIESSKVGKVACMNPHAKCAESEKVIETLKHMSHLYSEGKIDELSQYMDEGCTTFDEKRNKLIVGRDAVLSDIKSRWTSAHSGTSPIVSYTINHPYAQVTGDQAVVTFEAVKTIGGKNPETLVSRCTDIFVKKDGTWKKLHYRNCWKKGKPSA
jgi:hypothetical protein